MGESGQPRVSPGWWIPGQGSLAGVVTSACVEQPVRLGWHVLAQLKASVIPARAGCVLPTCPCTLLGPVLPLCCFMESETIWG